MALSGVREFHVIMYGTAITKQHVNPWDIVARWALAYFGFFFSFFFLREKCLTSTGFSLPF
jgi:hypothetical protein